MNNILCDRSGMSKNAIIDYILCLPKMQNGAFEIRKTTDKIGVSTVDTGISSTTKRKEPVKLELKKPNQYVIVILGPLLDGGFEG